MGTAFRCDICKEFYDGGPRYDVTIVDRHVDPRDGTTRKSLSVCAKCGKPLWDYERKEE